MVNKEDENSHGHNDCRFQTVDPAKLDKLLEDAPLLHDVAGTIRAAPFDFLRSIMRGITFAVVILIFAGMFFFLWRGFVYFSHTPAAPPSLPTKQL